MEYSNVKGTRDILPDETARWHYIENLARRLLHGYGYGELRTPLVEQTQLFVRTIGSGTDIVEKEMYTFPDKKGRSLTLRPEGTAGIIRSAIENNLCGEGKITRLYYIGPMYRYEKPQAGRQREFYQIGAELIGSREALSDVEVMLLVLDFFERLKLKGLVLYMNSVGCAGCRPRYAEAVKRGLSDSIKLMCPDCQRRYFLNPMRMLDCKDEKDRKIIEKTPRIYDYLCDDCSRHLEKVKGSLEEMGIGYEMDPYMVRGLDYYTKTAFEIKYGKLFPQDTIAAGGRYDTLVADLGGQNVPGTGFALGLERLVKAIEMENIALPSNEKTDVCVVSLGGEALRRGMKVVSALRKEGMSCVIDLSSRSLKAQMREASRIKSRYVVIIGDEELRKGKAVLRNMEKKKQEETNFSKIVSRLSARG